MLVVELIFRITMCTIREKKYGVRDITLNDKGEKKKSLLVCQRQYFLVKNLLSFCNGFLKNICVENIKNWVF